MIKTDPIVGEITPGTKPVLEPMPDVKPLPDGFRYKPDLANPTGQALHRVAAPATKAKFY